MQIDDKMIFIFMKHAPLVKSLIIVAGLMVFGFPAPANSQVDVLERTQTLQQRVEQRSQVSTQARSDAATDNNSSSSSVQPADEYKQRVCERRQAAVNKRTEAIMLLLQKQQEFLDKAFGQLQQFMATRQTAGTIYQGLLESTQQAKQTTSLAITEVNKIKVELDCQHEEHLWDATGYKQTVRSAVGELKSYRGELRELLNTAKTSIEADS